MVDLAEKNMAGVMMAQRQMSFVHPFSFEFKRLAYEAVKQKAEGMARRRRTRSCHHPRKRVIQYFKGVSD